MFMKLVKHYGNIGWKVHELAWPLHKIKFELLWSYLTKMYYAVQRLFLIHTEVNF